MSTAARSCAVTCERPLDAAWPPPWNNEPLKPLMPWPWPRLSELLWDAGGKWPPKAEDGPVPAPWNGFECCVLWYEEEEEEEEEVEEECCVDERLKGL